MLFRSVQLYGVDKGDIAYLYGNCGEGAADMWVHGKFFKCAEPNFSWHPGYGCQQNCDGHWLSLGKSEWWAHIRLKMGSTGWVLVEGNFAGVDALADSASHRPDMANTRSSSPPITLTPDRGFKCNRCNC